MLPIAGQIIAELTSRSSLAIPPISLHTGPFLEILQLGLELGFSSFLLVLLSPLELCI
jgi:hypothetical protein